MEEDSSSLQHFHLIFGYGSLICPESRAITAPTVTNNGMICPVLVRNIERIWAKQSKTLGATFMGVQVKEGASCTGVLIPAKDKELEEFDARESGYYRKEIPKDLVEPVPHLITNLTNSNIDETGLLESYKDLCLRYEIGLPENGANDLQNKNCDDSEKKLSPIVPPRIWVYIPDDLKLPSSHFPIVQSYVDIIIRGCLTISKEFAEDFLCTTKGWNPVEAATVNQRIKKKPGWWSDDFLHTNEEKEAFQFSVEKKQSIIHGTAAKKKVLGWWSEEFLETSNGWNPDEGKLREKRAGTTRKKKEKEHAYWIDDRSNPRYPRADKEYSFKHKEEIDKLLRSVIPVQYAHRTVQRFVHERDGHS